MTKINFLMSLNDKLSGLPKNDIEERLSFYAEIIEDRMEEGLSEEDAVNAVGTVDEIAAQIISDTPLSKIIKEKIKPKRQHKAWEIVLLVLGSPIWFSLMIAVFAVFISLYVSLWSVIISLWSVFGSFVGCSIGGIVAGVVFALGDNTLIGIAVIGVGFVFAGVSIFLFYGCKAATKCIILLTKKIVLGIKNCFIKKGDA